MEYASHDFGPDFEEQVLNVILLDPVFLARFRPVINQNAFIIENNRCLTRIVTAYFDEYGHAPSKRILEDVIRADGAVRDKGGVLQRIADAAHVPDVDYVVNRMLSWVKWTEIETVLRSHNGEKPKEFADKITKAASIGDDLLFDHTNLDAEDKNEHVKNDTIATPWNWLNEQIDGGPEIGDLAVILTVISGGKTTALVNIAHHAVSLGKFVVYFTFEDGEKKIKRRMVQRIANATRSQLITDRERINRKRNRFLVRTGGRCEIKDLQSRRSTVDDAASFVRSLQDNSGRKVDLVVTDYADRFGTKSHYSEPRHSLREIFEDCKWFARNLSVVHWTARQVNKTRVGKEIVGADAAGESWGSMESPDLVIGLGRTIEDEEMDRMTMYTAKVRDEKDHQRHSLITDFEHQRIWDPND